jgi:hypothetical protein
MKGKVKDLAFAHSTDQIMLGVVDEFGNLFVFRIEKTNDEDDSDCNAKPLATETMLQINASCAKDISNHRLIW